MSFMRKLMLKLTSYNFRLVLLLFALVTAFALVFGQPDQIKQALRSNDTYEKAIETTLNEATKNREGQESPDAAAQKQIKEAAKSAITPQVAQSTVEQIIDGTYHWLQGKSTAPDFKVDLTPVIKSFVAKTSEATTKRLRKLPPCTVEQLRQLDPHDLDYTSLDCAPPGLNATVVRQQIERGLAGGENEFFRKPVLTAETFSQGKNGETVFEQANSAPQYFQWAMLLPWILGTLAVLLGVGVLFLSENKRKGVRSLAGSSLGVGIFVAISSLISYFLFSRASQPDGNIERVTSGGFEQVLLGIVNSLGGLISRNLLIIGAIYIVLGIIGLVVLRLKKPIEPAIAQASESTHPPIPEAQRPETPNTEDTTQHTPINKSP